MRQPVLMVHADWSLHPRKRWVARAISEGNRYRLEPPELAGAASTLLYRLRAEAGAAGTVLLGTDFPIGLPLSYASRVGANDFVALLPRLGYGEWADFYRVAETPNEIGLRRPFYPYRPGGTSHKHLLEGLGVERMDDLRRQCELAHAERRAAAPLFWTLGSQQVGKAAISGWRDMLAPALRDGAFPLTLWPFQGELAALLRPGQVVVAETYPAEEYGHLGLSFGARSKRDQAARAANGARLLTWAEQREVKLAPALAAAVRNGFGPGKEGEDPFDALVGLLGMLDVVRGQRPAGAPPRDAVRRVEGWILGQQRSEIGDQGSGTNRGII